MASFEASGRAVGDGARGDRACASEVCARPAAGTISLAAGRLLAAEVCIYWRIVLDLFGDLPRAVKS